MKIVIDAGHGPNTPGKRVPDDSMREYMFNSATARYVCEELAKYTGVETLCTFEDSRDVPLKERTDRANMWKADVYVSIHANAMGDGWDDSGVGIETFTYVTKPEDSVKLANIVNGKLVAATGRPNRGVKAEDFHVLRETHMTAILCECGFMTSHTEAALLKTDDYRRKCAKAIADGLAECYGLQRNDAATPSASLPFTIVKERIYAEGGVLKRCDGNYGIPASDVRYIKFPAGQFRFKFVARKGAKVSDLVKEFAADYGTNAPYFWDGAVLGDCVADGAVISVAYGKLIGRHAFGFADGKAEIGVLNPAAKKWDALVQGAPLLIENGKLAYDYYRKAEQVPDDIGIGGAQRTVYGIDADGAVHIAVADGRTKYDRGPTLEEMALYMQSKGCVWALNFDGGSSSVIADKTGSLGQNTGADEKAVNHAMLIYAEKAEIPGTPVDWRQAGVDWLRANGGITDAHDPKETVDIGTLGVILRNLKK